MNASKHKKNTDFFEKKKSELSNFKEKKIETIKLFGFLEQFFNGAVLIT